MFDEPFVKTMPPVETKIEHLIAKVPALDVQVDVPTVDQVHANDEVFQHKSNDADKVLGLLGMVSGMMMLHDVAVDTMLDLDDLEGHLQRKKLDDDDEEEDKG